MRVLVLAILVMVSGIATAQEAAPDTSAIEAAHAAWTAKDSKKTRKALDKALEEYTGPPTTASVLAHLARVQADGASQKSSKLRDSALAAADHLEPAASQIPQQYLDLRYVAAVALFNYRHDVDALTEMAAVEGQAYQLKQAADDENSAFEATYYNAQAWGMAMEAYFDSVGKRRPSEEELEAILTTYGADTETLKAEARAGEDGESPEEESRLPFCEGGLDMQPSLRYPRQAARKGMVGAVIIKFDQDSSGNIINPVILASVPDEGFKDKAQKTVAEWTFEAASDARPGESCRLERENLLLPVVFQLK